MNLSSECKLTKLILQAGCPSYNLTSWREPAVIQKPSAQISKAFNQHGIAEKTIYLAINALWINAFFIYFI